MQATIADALSPSELKRLMDNPSAKHLHSYDKLESLTWKDLNLIGLELLRVDYGPSVLVPAYALETLTNRCLEKGIAIF